MITAKEAKEIYDKSGAEVANIMEKLNVEQAVKSAAEGGKRSTIVYLGDEIWWSTRRSVVTRLRELGYGAVIGLYGDKYVPRGLQDDNGEGPVHQNYGIHISW